MKKYGKSSAGQAKMAKGIAGLVKTYVDTKGPKLKPKK